MRYTGYGCEDVCLGGQPWLSLLYLCRVTYLFGVETLIGRIYNWVVETMIVMTCFCGLARAIIGFS